jgi:hemerythrin-like domain-containing protein
MTTATTALRSEHDYILAMIACLRAACAEASQGVKFDVETFRVGVDFIRNYADAWHHAKEEDHLFPAMEASGMPREGGPIGVMLHEHVVGRSYVGKIRDHLEAAADGDNEARLVVLRYSSAYAQLLTQHIQKENNILFDMADQMFSQEEHDFLVRQYQSAIPENADTDTGSHYEQLVLKLCRQWNVDPADAAKVGQSFHCG